MKLRYNLHMSVRESTHLNDLQWTRAYYFYDHYQGTLFIIKGIPAFRVGFWAFRKKNKYLFVRRVGFQLAKGRRKNGLNTLAFQLIKNYNYYLYHFVPVWHRILKGQSNYSKIAGRMAPQALPSRPSIWYSPA